MSRVASKLDMSSSKVKKRDTLYYRGSKFEPKLSKVKEPDGDRRKMDCSIQPGFGNLKWHQAIKQLFDIVKNEPPIDQNGQTIQFKPVRQEQTLDYLSEKFINYVLILQKLSDCLPRLIHPQKRRLLKKCIESTAARVCELKHQMIQWNKCLYHYFDDLLRDMGLTPDNLEITIPVYLLKDRHHILSMRQQLLAWMIQRIEALSDPKVEDIVNMYVSSRESFDVKINANKPASPIEKEKEKMSVRTSSSDDINRYVPDFHCQTVIRRLSRDVSEMTKLIKLQSWCRSWHAKKKTKRLREEEFVSLGMSFPKRMVTLINQEDLDEEYNEQEAKHAEREDDMMNKKQFQYEQFLETKGLDMAWELKMNLTQWLLEMMSLQGRLPDYPEDEEGGCDAIFQEKTVEDLEAEIEAMFRPRKAKKQSKGSKKPKKPAPEDPGWKMPPSSNLMSLIGLLNEYDSYWYYKFERDNPFQTFDMDLVMDEVQSEAGKIIRQQVDKLMRYELENMKLALENTVYKSAPDKIPTQKLKTATVKLGPTGERTVEELYGELVLMGLVKPVNSVKMKDIIGDHNFQRAAQRECIPTIPDIKNIVTLLLGLPLSSEFVHKATPILNTMLFAGPPGTGKTMLLHAICRETGSNLIDLSPATLNGKYIGTEEQNYLKAALLKVGKALEPTVFYVDECELVFPLKPGPKSDDNPARWASFLQGLMKKLKQGDRMALIGLTHLPFYCKTKSLLNVFKNVIFFPTPEYGSRTAMWKALLAKLPLLRTNLNVSVLSKLTEGYSFREIQFVIDNVLHADRLSRCRPITNDEFIQCLSMMSRPSSETTQAWLDWYDQIPMVQAYKAWQDVMDEMDSLLEQAAK
uniref:AAA+ ATPase domain-containing protein n=1 Tax=Biomphalaria glabrata TaxID=6526 RepID=A0A2C9JQ92_BIOGL